ncbi:hypothetical protein MMC11_003793 [Xylographa trunciseda]|nr:hypothetical protein [Xylographa trunciseda]
MRLARAVSAEQRDGLGRRGSLLGSKNKYGAEIIQEIQRDSDIDAKDNSGSAPLHLAIRRWIMTPQVQRQSTRLLLRKKANANAQDNAGNTPLHIAATSGLLKAVQLLLECGADPHIMNNKGATALQLATNNLRSPSAVQILTAQTLYNVTSEYDTADDGGDKEREAVIELLKRYENAR